MKNKNYLKNPREEDVWGENEEFAEMMQNEEPYESVLPTEKFKIFKDGEKTEVSIEELLALAQSGADVQALKNERDDLRNSPFAKLIAQFKKQSGLSEKAMIGFLQKCFAMALINDKAQKLIAMGYDSEQAKSIAQAEYEKESAGSENEILAESEKRKLMQQFVEAFPDVRELPKEILPDIERGENPTVAYQKFLIEKLKRELKNSKTDIKNKNSYTGSVKGGKFTPEDELSRIFMEA